MQETLVLVVGFCASIGAYLSKTFVLEPLLRFRAVKGRIQNRLKFYSNVITNSGLGAETELETRVSLRQLSCDLEEAYYAVGLRSMVSGLGMMPRSDAVENAAINLIFLSNAANMRGKERQNHDAIEAVETALEIG